jgi:flavin reductase (DIM6/NTAB) family NADH-FMN oxidoreductase RutF
MSSEHSEFARLMGQHHSSLFIVTTATGNERSGCLVGFASQVSIHPQRFLICLSVKNRTFAVAQRARVLAVHFVSEQAEGLAVLFGGQTGDKTDKFAQCQWRPGPDGVPVLAALEDWFAGLILERMDFGDHHGFLLEPIDGEAHRSGSPFTFRRARWIVPGHEP